jgi:Kef-type K+ transport system membrane component KefB
MNINTDFSYYKKNNNLLYDIPVFISSPEILSDTSINYNILSKEYNKINISDKFIRDLSMYGYININEFFDNSNNNFQILIIVMSFILFIYIIFSFFC